MYPEAKNEKYNIEKKSKILKFKEKIDVNIDFYTKLKGLVEDYGIKNNSQKIKEDSKMFHEMLIITFSN